MREDCRLITLLALIGSAALVSAQGFYPPNPYFAGGVAFRPRSGVRVVVGVRGPLPFNPYYGRVVSRVSYFSVYAPPPPPPIIIIQQPPYSPLDDLPPPPPPMRELIAPPAVPEIPPVPLIPPVPDIPPIPGEPIPLPKEKPKEKPRPPLDDDTLRLPRREIPHDDPLDESARLLVQGREDFVEGNYGRAAQRFRRAGRLRPKVGLPSFLLAQALLASGKYHEATDAIVAGLDLMPNWPRGDFRPLDLYGPSVLEYSEHLRLLEETRERHPDNPVLLFLAGYQLWFDGRRDEARDLFRRVTGPLAAPAERFLRALPPEDAI